VACCLMVMELKSMNHLHARTRICCDTTSLSWCRDACMQKLYKNKNKNNNKNKVEDRARPGNLQKRLLSRLRHVHIVAAWPPTSRAFAAETLSLAYTTVEKTWPLTTSAPLLAFSNALLPTLAKSSFFW